MRAEIISTGTELLLGKTLNTSAFYITGQLSGIGIEVDFHTTVGDNKERLAGAVKQAFKRSDLIVLTGGLGPTADDLTKEIIGLFLHLKMDFSEESMKQIQQFYDQKTALPPGSQKQAYFPQGSKILPNDCGTAPGALLKKDGKYFVILPGPPSEMKPMFDKYVLPRMQEMMNNNPRKMCVRTLKVFGLGESEIEEALPDLMNQDTPFLTLLDKHTYMDIRITLRDQDEESARKILDQTEIVMRERLGNQIFGVDEESHSQVVGRLLNKNKLTLATAESCSGGLLGGRITAEAGSSEYYLGGIISYANSVKEGLLKVKKTNLDTYGAVSEQVAKEMAVGAREVFLADVALSTTGIAGPGGGTKDKALGLVYIALAYPGGIQVVKKQFTGNRDSIRNMTVECALNILRVFLLNLQKK